MINLNMIDISDVNTKITLSYLVVGIFISGFVATAVFFRKKAFLRTSLVFLIITVISGIIQRSEFFSIPTQTESYSGSEICPGHILFAAFVYAFFTYCCYLAVNLGDHIYNLIADKLRLKGGKRIFIIKSIICISLSLSLAAVFGFLLTPKGMLFRGKKLFFDLFFISSVITYIFIHKKLYCDKTFRNTGNNIRLDRHIYKMCMTATDNIRNYVFIATADDMIFEETPSNNENLSDMLDSIMENNVGDIIRFADENFRNKVKKIIYDMHCMKYGNNDLCVSGKNCNIGDELSFLLCIEYSDGVVIKILGCV